MSAEQMLGTDSSNVLSQFVILTLDKGFQRVGIRPFDQATSSDPSSLSPSLPLYLMSFRFAREILNLIHNSSQLSPRELLLRMGEAITFIYTMKNYLI